MEQSEMKKFLEDKGIEVQRVEGDDFSAVFHVSADARAKAEKNKEEWERATGLYLATSDMGGFSVIIMENAEEED